MSSPTADVSVRVAWADDAPAIGGLQARAWRTAYGDLVPAEALPDEATATEAWHASLTRPADARNRVLVALERNRVTGFAVVGPAADPDCDPIVDGELLELTVDADERAKGHGSRLLTAVVETMAADGFTRGVFWAIATDEELRSFLTTAGWAADTAHRELDLDGTGSTRVKQVRLHTALS